MQIFVRRLILKRADFAWSPIGRLGNYGQENRKHVPVAAAVCRNSVYAGYDAVYGY